MDSTTHSPFTTIRIEGAILPPDLLQRIADGDAGLEARSVSPESYHLAKGEKINEAINRAWNRVLGAWAAFRDASAKLAESDPGTTLTRERWLLPLFQELGYGRLATAKAIEIAGDAYPISHGWQSTPIHLVGCHVDLDARTKGVAGAARNSPHGLVQILLNRSDAHLWAFVSNGLRLRVLRDNKMLTRQAFVEFDLQAMMDGQVYSDFVLLWLVCHQSRVEADKPEECWLEKWSRAAAEQGTRALDQLRGGVEEAISALGRGFLAHPANRNLRDKLYAGKLDAQDYYRQLLRLVYRLIFLFVAEDRGLLFVPTADANTRDIFSRFYSTAKLCTLAERRRGTRHADLYHGLRLVMEKLGSDIGCIELGLPALGGFLFSAQAIPDIEQCEIANHDLLDAFRALAFTLDRNARRVVDYKNLGSEELGSVYESLLELHPIINSDAHSFELKTASGNERKTTGSFYTPTPLINVLLDSALDPILDEACRKSNPEQAILALKVCDSAGGSGHIAIAAARRIAKRLATIRTGDEEPSPEAMHTALRDVITQCIYVVDVNPMAIELCKVNLWMEMQDPRYPLSFLDAHIKCGNSLIGVAPGMDIGEIPDEAFNPVTGDHKPTAASLKKRNKGERTSGQLPLMVTVLESLDDLQRWVTERARQLNAMPEDDATQVQAKSEAYRQLTESEKYARRKLEYDLWTAAFFWRISAPDTEMSVIAPTQSELAKLRRGEKLNPDLVRQVQALAERLRFFHWELEFPEVFEQGGFDVKLMNPPWERIKLQEEEFFAARDPGIATAPNKAARQKLIDALPKKNPALAQEFEDAKHDAEATSKFVRESKRFPLTAVGDVNTYALFAEHARTLLNPKGRAGIILPTGIATDDATKDFFADLIEKHSLASLYDFENREAIFQGVHRSYKFCLLTMSGNQENRIDFVFFATRVEHLRDKRRQFVLASDEIALFNPNTRTCPVFRTRADADLTKKIYRNVPVFVDERVSENLWQTMYRQGLFHSSTDADAFNTNTHKGIVLRGRKLVDYI
jgi:methylase of polypeptide subunit release factors